MSTLLISKLYSIFAPFVVQDSATTANAYASAAIVDSYGKSKIAFIISNTHGANALKWKVLASIDGVTYVEIEAEAGLAAGASATWLPTDAEAAYRYFDIQVQSSVAGAHATYDVSGIAKC